MTLHIEGISTSLAERLRARGDDANGQRPVLRTADGPDPCRHCLQLIEPGDTKLVLAHRPFPVAQPYAETGPIFLHQVACDRFEGGAFPDWFAFLDPAVIRGYDGRDWIRYDTGAVVQGRDLHAACETVLEDPDVAYVHVRSKFGCFQCRVERSA